MRKKTPEGISESFVGKHTNTHIKNTHTHRQTQTTRAHTHTHAQVDPRKICFTPGKPEPRFHSFSARLTRGKRRLRGSVKHMLEPDFIIFFLDYR